MTAPVNIRLRLDSQSQTLCSLCSNLVLIVDSEDDQQHHMTYASLDNAADTGCAMCRVLRYALTHPRRAMLEQRPPTPADIAYWHQSCDSSGKTLPFRIQLSYQFSYVHYWRHEDEEMFNLNTSHWWPQNQMYTMHDVLQRPVSLTLHLSKATLEGNRSEISAIASIETCKTWLIECGEHKNGTHSICPDLDDVELPTRLIQVDLLNRDTVSLGRTAGHEGKYLALSHCWGDSPDTIRTISSNLSNHHASIPFSKLPQTFKDAVTVTRELGFKYLWIDSLCIVQDDAADWERESAKMGLIYQRAAVTLAASMASDAQAGFLKSRHLHAPPILLRGLGSDHVELDRFILSHFDPVHEDYVMPECRLLSRGWVLQERLLSPRVIFFDKNAMYFDCLLGRSAEGRPDIPFANFASRNLGMDCLLSNCSFGAAFENPHRLWMLVVEEYTRLDLTYKKDMLPALSGIAQSLEERSASSLDDSLGDYIAGLWTSHIGLFLSWTPEGPRKEYRSRDGARLPTWSWTSCERAVTFQKGEMGSFVSSIELVSHNVQPAGVDRYGGILPGACLRLVGHLVQCRVLCLPLTHDTSSTRCYLVDDKDEWVADFVPDDEDQFRAKRLDDTDHCDAMCLLLGSEWSETTPRHLNSWLGLVLLPLAKQTYERFGACDAVTGICDDDRLDESWLETCSEDDRTREQTMSEGFARFQSSARQEFSLI